MKNKNMEKIDNEMKSGIEKFKRIIKTKKGVNLIGFICLIVGVVFGFISPILSGYNASVGMSFMNMGKALIMVFILLFMYQILAFSNKKDKQKDYKNEDDITLEKVEKNIENTTDESSKGKCKECGTIMGLFGTNYLCPKCDFPPQNEIKENKINESEKIETKTVQSNGNFTELKTIQ